ncbi:MAG: hypothetical protein Q4G42_01435, partial [Neisseria sp.]|nr:hypothetical protein [Neisseria sp.]
AEVTALAAGFAAVFGAAVAVLVAGLAAVFGTAVALLAADWAAALGVVTEVVAALSAASVADEVIFSQDFITTMVHGKPLLGSINRVRHKVNITRSSSLESIRMKLR